MWYLGVRAGFSQKEMGWLQAVSPAAAPHIPPPASETMVSYSSSFGNHYNLQFVYLNPLFLG